GASPSRERADASARRLWPFTASVTRQTVPCVRKAPKVLTIFLWSSARTRSISSASLGRIAGLSRSLRRTRRDTGRLSFLSTARYVSPNGPRENGPSTSYLPSRTVPDESAGGGADTDPHLRPRLSGRSM